MKGLLLLLWELPQDLLGLGLLALLRLSRNKSVVCRDRQRCFVETEGLGISLGWFVFWPRAEGMSEAMALRTRDHEFGHSIQSRLFGPLYLLLVGLPSVSRVAWSTWHMRRTGQHWPHYYRGWPENHADWLGGVVHPRNRPIAPPAPRSPPPSSP